MRNITKPLDVRQITQAYPLIRALDPACSLESWRSYAASLTRRSKGVEASGVMTAQDADGYIYGLFTYRVVHGLRPARILLVDQFIAFEAVPGQATARALIAAMERLALEWRCGAIKVDGLLPAGPDIGSHDAALDLFRSAGHRPDTEAAVHVPLRSEDPPSRPPPSGEPRHRERDASPTFQKPPLFKE
ncbi:MAG: hypothetical protein ACE5Q3_15725 [Alphaproteobacteria bacterium]